MSTEHNERLHLIVKGFVQGVGFRYYIYKLGNYLKLSGWVKNKVSGNVEILAEGSREYLETILSEAKKGPPMAQVINVDVEWQNPTGDLLPFTILPTD